MSFSRPIPQPRIYCRATYCKFGRQVNGFIIDVLADQKMISASRVCESKSFFSIVRQVSLGLPWL